jgi:hypothetical protein
LKRSQLVRYQPWHGVRPRSSLVSVSRCQRYRTDLDSRRRIKKCGIKLKAIIDNVVGHFSPKQSIVDSRANEKNSWKNVNIHRKCLTSCCLIPKKNDTGPRMAACLKLICTRLTTWYQFSILSSNFSQLLSAQLDVPNIT